MADDYIFPNDEYILVGKIGKAHGLRGEVKVHALVDNAGALQDYTTLVLVDSKGKLSPTLAIENVRMQGRTTVVKIERVDDRNGAEALNGLGILIKKAQLKALEDGEYYWYQLKGLHVRTEQGDPVGVVKSIFFNGAQDILVVAGEKNEILIPVVEGIIISHTAEEVVIAPPLGLLELNSTKHG